MRGHGNLQFKSPAVQNARTRTARNLESLKKALSTIDNDSVSSAAKREKDRSEAKVTAKRHR